MGTGGNKERAAISLRETGDRDRTCGLEDTKRKKEIVRTTSRPQCLSSCCPSKRGGESLGTRFTERNEQGNKEQYLKKNHAPESNLAPRAFPFEIGEAPGNEVAGAPYENRPILEVGFGRVTRKRIAEARRSATA